MNSWFSSATIINNHKIVKQTIQRRKRDQMSQKAVKLERAGLLITSVTALFVMFLFVCAGIQEVSSGSPGDSLNSLENSSDQNLNFRSYNLKSSSDEIISTLAVDCTKKTVYYIGTKQGRIQRSLDKGMNWESVYTVPDSIISSIVSTPYGVFASSPQSDLLLSTNFGKSWLKVKTPENATAENIFYSSHQGGMLFLISTDRRIFIGNSEGKYWRDINLTLPPGDIDYITASSFDKYWLTVKGSPLLYHTANGGKHWETIRRPAPPKADLHSIQVDGINPETIWLRYCSIESVAPFREKAYYFKSLNQGDSWTLVDINKPDNYLISSEE